MLVGRTFQRGVDGAAAHLGPKIIEQHRKHQMEQPTKHHHVNRIYSEIYVTR